MKIDFPTYAEYLAANANPHRVFDSFGLDIEPGIKQVGPLLSYPTVTPEKAINAKRDPVTGNLPDIKTLQ